ncbi:protein kinase, partial [bacterium]|nr:protein kinase [bacterium]
MAAPLDAHARPVSARAPRGPSGRLPQETGDPDLASEIARARADPARAFGPFLLLSELGKGGMGVVYRAWNDRLRRVVALKTILPGGTVDAEAIKRFQREAEAVARLRHPNIVGIHEAGEISGRHYIAMDFVSGRTLERRLESKKAGERLPLTRALEALRDVARAVHYAHGQGVIHRDLKPQNILLDASDRPFVLDFGLARVRELGEKNRLTRTGAALGTPAYMPPEQTEGGSAEMDERSDVYSLGATLYHVLTGRPPFQGETELNVLTAVLTKDPVPPSKLNSRAAGDLETICLKCLEKEKERRYPTAEAFGREIDRYLAGEPIEARPIRGLERLARRARRNKLQAALALLALGAVLAALSVGAWAVKARLKDAAEREDLVRATREKMLESTRKDAERALASFKQKLAQARKAAPANETPEDRQRRLDPLLGLGFDARDATGRLAALVPEEKEAQLHAFEAAYSLGEVAQEAGQWSLAASAFEKARDLKAEAALSTSATLARAGVDRARRKLVDEHCAQVRKTIAELRDGAASGKVSAKDTVLFDDAVFALVAYREPETVSIVAGELDRATEKLRAAARAKLLEVALPDATEREAGLAPLDGLERAVDAFLALRVDGQLDPGTASVLADARRRLEDRAARDVHMGVLDWRALVAQSQENALGLDGVFVVRLSCEAL